MTARDRLSTQPNQAFADRLEARLVGALTGVAPIPADHFEEDLVTIDIDPGIDSPTPPTRHRATWMGFAAAAAAALLVVGILVTSDDSSSPSSPSAAGSEVSFEVEWPPFLSDDGVGLERPNCVTGFKERHGLTVNGCMRSFKGVTWFTGDVNGEGLWSMTAGTGYAVNNQITVPAPFSATYLFSGEVAGCGTGEFMMTSQLQFVGWDAGEFVGTWSIVPNSGRFELATIAGSGEVLPSSVPGPRTHIGSISC